MLAIKTKHCCCLSVFFYDQDVIRKMLTKGLKMVGRKDYIYVLKNSNISIEYNLTGPKDYKRVSIMNLIITINFDLVVK